MHRLIIVVAIMALAGCGSSTEPIATDTGPGIDNVGEPDWRSVDGGGDIGLDQGRGELPRLDTPCVPDCAAGACGDDGCGGECPACPLNQVCINGGCVCSWEACAEACCGEGMVCFEDACCLPQCAGMECGDDLCGDVCGICPEVAPICNNGICALDCIPDCEGKECGPDGCEGSCGECPGGTCVDATCCFPDCAGKDCGADGCGGDCGQCAPDAVCTGQGICCTPDCGAAVCGGDGCGGSCGLCPEMQVCEGGVCVLDSSYVGCSDMSREGFISIGDFPMIAACGGAWDVPGIHNETPACNREAGNTGVNMDGIGCNVTDLCAEGWHVCLGKDDVLYRSPSGCDHIMDGAQSPAFFLTRTSSTGAFDCSPDTIGSPTTVNDIFGCGDLGCPATQATCFPLQKGSHDGCKALKNKPTSSCECWFKGDLPPDDPAYDPGNFTDVLCKPSSGGCGWCSPLDYFNVLLGVYHPNAWDCGSAGSTEANNVVKSYPDQQGGVICCYDQCAIDLDCPDGQICIMSTCQ